MLNAMIYLLVILTPISSVFTKLLGKRSTCSEECFSLARLNLFCQSCFVLRETFVQLGTSFRGGATTPNYWREKSQKHLLLPQN